MKHSTLISFYLFHELFQTFSNYLKKYFGIKRMKHHAETRWAGVLFLWVWVWVSTSQRIPSSVLVRNSYKGLAREISYVTGRRQGKTRTQSSGQMGVTDSQGKATVSERQPLKEELWLVDQESGSASAKGWISVPGSCVGILFGYTLVIYTYAQRCQNFLPFCP